MLRRRIGLVPDRRVARQRWIGECRRFEMAWHD
jgi:hypothetical protein